MKKHTILNILTSISLFMPLISYAQLNGVFNFLVAFRGLISLMFPILVGLGVIFFLWGLGQFILHDAGNDKTREDGKKKMIWGVVALFIMTSIWSILSWLGNTINIPVNFTQP